jgi:hypothetical protein
MIIYINTQANKTMELVNELRNGFKERITKWLTEREYTTGECYPFAGWDALTVEIANEFHIMGIHFVGRERFGETLTFAGQWISEGVAVELNINPTLDKKDFRVLWRWR